MAEAETGGLEIQYRSLEKLIPYARNARTHTEDQIHQVAASIREFGFTNPVLLRYDNDSKVQSIVAGHARCEAARLLGLQEVPTINLDHLTQEQARAYIIADNRLAEQAGWDLEMLQVEFDDLSLAGFDIDLTGFDEKARVGIVNELERQSEANRREDEDNPTEIPVETEIYPGQLIELGSHKLICGDATDPDVHRALLDKEKPALMVTDPPYGVELDANWRKKHFEAPERHVIPNDDRADWTEVWRLFQGEVAYVWHGGLHAATVAENLSNCGFEIRSQIIWHKSRFAISRSHYHWQHEPCWYAVRRNATGHWTGSRKESTVWDIEMMKALEYAHPNQKPVECMRRPILNNSNPGQLVFDPFGGTGTTLVACELTGRSARIIELEPKFCQVIVDRYKMLFEKNDGA